MALTKEVTQDKIEIVGEFKSVQVRTKTAVLEDGVELSSGFHRHVVSAGDDYSAESTEVQAICAAVHTDAVVAAYAAHVAASALGEQPMTKARENSDYTGLAADIAAATPTVSATAPSSPAAGEMWFDTNANSLAMKVWKGSYWNLLNNSFSASGGTISTYVANGIQYRVHKFLSSGTFTVVGSGLVEYLVVAGGGGGGGTAAEQNGAGGAGGYRSSLVGESTGGGGTLESALLLTDSAHTVTIGGGGAAGGSGQAGVNGSNSVFSSITSLGGGGGALRYNNGASGGSGGGGGDVETGTTAGGAGTAGQGFAGATGRNHGNPTHWTDAGGGGGAGSAGGVGGTGQAYSAGDGLASATAGVTLAKGGTVDEDPDPNIAGTANSGNGGGTLYAGGSGIVLVRYVI